MICSNSVQWPQKQIYSDILEKYLPLSTSHELLVLFAMSIQTGNRTAKANLPFSHFFPVGWRLPSS